MNESFEYLNISNLTLNSKDEIKFLIYVSLSADCENYEIEQWIERSTFICEDIMNLLNMTHKEFWTQILHNKMLHDCITSFLRNSRRPYDNLLYNQFNNLTIKKLEENLHKKFFLVCLRMATNKESASLKIENEKFARIIYDQSVFDIPRFLDFCAIYSKDNTLLVRKMISSLFKLQPKYYNDLTVMVQTLFNVFSAIEQKMGAEKSDGPKKLNIEIDKNGLKTVKEIYDLFSYLSDVSHTLLYFLECLPCSAPYFYAENFPQKLAEFYENFTLHIYTNILKLNLEINIIDKLNIVVDVIRLNLLSIFNLILKETLLEKFKNNKESEILFDKYIDNRLTIMPQMRFLADLERLYPINIEINYIIQHIPSIDIDRFDYLIEAIESACEIYPVEKALGAIGLSESSNLKIDSNVYQVMEVFPELDFEYICQSLMENDNDAQKVINNLLENPKHNFNIKKDGNNFDNKNETNVMTSNSILSTRHNVYDGDEFDIFKKDNIDLSSIHKGKQSRINNEMHKQLKEHLKPLYEKLSNEFHYDSIYDKDIEFDNDTLYEDEYDDTYDTLGAAGNLDADSADELSLFQVSTTKSKYINLDKDDKYLSISQKFRNNDDTHKEDNCGLNHIHNVSQKTVNNTKNFLEDPAELRRIKEEKRQAQHIYKKTFYKQGENAPKRDVVGGQKGKGQSEEVLKNRDYKEKNKATRVHHNRKNLADRKRNI